MDRFGSLIWGLSSPEVNPEQKSTVQDPIDPNLVGFAWQDHPEPQRKQLAILEGIFLMPRATPKSDANHKEI